jgi:N-glycosidase YbiA
VIRFYSTTGEYGCFSNFSRHPIKMKGKVWKTSEHYFQAQKFAGLPEEEKVRKCERAKEAATMGRDRKNPLRKDWMTVRDNVMHEVVYAKFTQHEDLKKSFFLRVMKN